MVNFTADASTSSGGQILSYQWIFGDGFEAEDVQTSHTYQAGGIYVVRLIVSDSNGFESVAESQVMVTRDDGVQGELVDYVLDPGFERDDNGFENYYNISSTERSGEHSIEGEISLRASFPGWSNVILPVDYPWSEGPNGYSLVASAQVRVDEMSSETSAELCAVAYWSTGSGEARHESCTDLPQPGSEVVIVRAVLELDPEVPLNRIHFWLAYPHVGEATITIDDAHLVLDKVAS
jgi:PKD repeat protein